MFPDPGAPCPRDIVKKVRSFDSPALPIRLGVCVLRPSAYKDLYSIARWFYDEIGHLPVFHEVNYGYYERPTDGDFQHLGDSIERVLEEFGSDGTLSLFPSVSSELSFGGDDPYVFDLDLENTYQISKFNIEEKVHEIATNLRTENYQSLDCRSVDCP